MMEMLSLITLTRVNFSFIYLSWVLIMATLPNKTLDLDIKADLLPLGGALAKQTAEFHKQVYKSLLGAAHSGICQRQRAK